MPGGCCKATGEAVSASSAHEVAEVVRLPCLLRLAEPEVLRLPLHGVLLTTNRHGAEIDKKIGEFPLPFSRFGLSRASHTGRCDFFERRIA